MLERLTWLKESTYRWNGDGISVYVDVWGASADPVPADVVFITHAHFDHFDEVDLLHIKRPDTIVFAPRDVANQLAGEVIAVAPGDSLDAGGIKGEAVPAYNIVEGRLDAHPKENGWVGYVLELDGKRYYFSGDTDALPELEQLQADVAFVCVGGDPYVMNATEAAGLVRSMEPELAVPNHYGWPVGSKEDAETFRQEAAPIPVEIMQPVVPFGAG